MQTSNFILLLASISGAAAAGGENCQKLNITTTDITFQVDTLSGVKVSLCNELYTPPRCPGSKDVVSSPIEDGYGNKGSYNIADTFSALTSSNRLVRIGHSSFVYTDVGSIYVQSYQDCGSASSSEDCYTRIAVTGGDGKYDCAQGIVDFQGTNSANIISYIANFCNTCKGGTTSSGARDTISLHHFGLLIVFDAFVVNLT
jgi:hypothetical protein